jgi:leucyl-tRNA synthetase
MIFAPKERELFLKILAPFAPHITEELWQQLATSDQQQATSSRLKKKTMSLSSMSRVALNMSHSIHLEPWPQFDAKLIEDETFVLVVQISGKVRDSFEVSKSITQAEAEKLTLARESVKKHISTKPKRVIYVPGRLINIVL